MLHYLFFHWYCHPQSSKHPQKKRAPHAHFFYLFLLPPLLLIAFIYTLSFKRVGYGTQVIPRPQLHAILLALVPKEKILVNKSIESLVQDTESVTVTCEDGSTYTADMLIGADGSDSGTRRALYKDMEKDGITPKIIEEENKTLYMSVFGTTDPMDPANFEGLDDDCTRCDTVVGDERGLTVSRYLL